MFKRRQQESPEIDSLRIRVRELERAYYDIRRDFSKVMDKWEMFTIVKQDMAKMDAVVAMVSELARRVDLAGIADLPNECVCEACGCKK